MWMQMARKMRLAEAKQYVAEKLKVEPLDLVDECVMRYVREDLGIGPITAVPGAHRGIAAKQRIGELLGIEINSVNKMWHKS
jgi:dimethylamine--corrinoid protein Co-methyltransferase